MSLRRYVMKTRKILVILFVLFIVGCGGSGQSGQSDDSAHLLYSGQVSGDNLLQQSDFTYMGAFQVPKSGSGYASFQYGGYTVAYNAIGNSTAMCTGSKSPYPCCTGAGTGTCGGGGSLFMVGNGAAGYTSGYFAEINTPSPVCLNGIGNAVSCTNYVMPSTPTSNLTNLNTASLIQGFVDDTYGLQNGIASSVIPNGYVNTGLLVYNGKLIGDTKAYYDPGYKQTYSHFTNNLNLSMNNFSGYYELGGGLPKQGYTPGPMGAIPSAYQSQVGGKILTGQSLGVAIVTTESYGPCAIALDPSNLVPSNLPPAVIPATALIYYDPSHPLPGGYWANDQASNVYTSPSDKIYGVAFPGSTRSVLFFGQHGLSSDDGYSCYGEGSSSLASAYVDGCPGGAGTCQISNRLIGYGGAVTSGTFTPGETVRQAITNATATLMRVDTGGTGDLEFLGSNSACTGKAIPYACCTGAGTGTCTGGMDAISGADKTDVWVGQTSGAIFTPQAGKDFGDPICYDPAKSGPGQKGNHSYPYVNYVWAYDAGIYSGHNTPGNNVKSLSSTHPGKNNLTAVKLGFIKPYEVVPYATWTFTLPTGASALNPGTFKGVAWDPANRLLYITQSDADQGVYAKFPVVHVYKLGIP